MIYGWKAVRRFCFGPGTIGKPRVHNGSRVNIVMNPVALNGPIVTIRRFPDKPITMERLLQIRSISAEAAEFLKKLVQAKYNIFISGDSVIIGLS